MNGTTWFFAIGLLALGGVAVYAMVQAKNAEARALAAQQRPPDQGPLVSRERAAADNFLTGVVGITRGVFDLTID